MAIGYKSVAHYIQTTFTFNILVLLRLWFAELIKHVLIILFSLLIIVLNGLKKKTSNKPINNLLLCLLLLQGTLFFIFDGKLNIFL